MNNNIVKLDTGRFFTAPFSYIGYILIVVGLYNLFMLEYKSVLIIAGGLFITFTREKIDINTEEHRYKLYLSIFGINKVLKQPNEAYPYIALRRKNFTQRTYGIATRSIVTSNTYYYIYLISANRRDRLAISRSKGLDAAKIELKQMAEALKVDII